MIRRVVALAVLSSSVLCIALMLLWARSMRYEDQFMWRRPYDVARAGFPFFLASSDHGQLYFLWSAEDTEDDPPLTLRTTRSPLVPEGVMSWWGNLGFHYRRDWEAGYWAFSFSIPHGALALAASIVPLYWMRRQRRALGGCRSCGYNLTGNVSGVCPECGTAIQQKATA